MYRYTLQLLICVVMLSSSFISFSLAILVLNLNFNGLSNLSINVLHVYH